jgi:ribosomal protein L34E
MDKSNVIHKMFGFTYEATTVRVHAKCGWVKRPRACKTCGHSKSNVKQRWGGVTCPGCLKHRIVR